MLKNRNAEKNREELRRIAVVGANRSCFDCGARGPTYAVTDFFVFVCTQCSALHRSMQHKVKGISMSDFTDEEVAGLRICGNDRGVQVWRRGFLPSQQPREGDERGLREVIRKCFVDQVYLDQLEYAKVLSEIDQAVLPPVTAFSELGGLSALQRAPPPPQVAKAGQQPRLSVTAISPAPTPAPASSVQPAQRVGHQPARTPAPPAASQADSFSDFFGGPSAPSASPPPVQQPAHAPALSTNDFFGGHEQLQQKSAPTEDFDDFFSGASSSPAGATPFAAPPPPIHNGGDFFASIPQGGVVLTHKKDRDAFASLDPFA